MGAGRTGWLALPLVLVVPSCEKETEPTPCRMDGQVVAWTADEQRALPHELSSCPARLDCAPGHAVEEVEVAGALAYACVDRRGRYDGPAVAVERRGDSTVIVRGHYRLEAPDGDWSCSRAGDGERLDFTIDGAVFARELWGVALGDLPGVRESRHLGPTPNALCPTEDWAALPHNRFEVEPLGKLEERGVVTSSRHHQAGTGTDVPTRR